MKKYIVLVASVLIMLCLGGVYAWSIFVPPLKAEHDLTTTQTQLVFGFTIAVFAIAMIAAGRLEKKRGPRLTAIIGGALFSAGYLLASFSNGEPFFIFLGVGIFSGAGLGFGYVCALITPIKWFPQKKGLITGLSVAGFGAGAILLSYLVKFFLGNELPVLDIFRLVGLSYGAVIILSAMLLTVPADVNAGAATTSFQYSQLLKDRKFWALCCGLFAGTFAGLLVVGNLKPIGLSFGADETIATAAISLLALGNMGGRILWGYLSDLMGGRRAIIAALSFLAIVTLSLLAGAGYQVSFMLLALAIGAGFGANFVLFATEVSQIYGVEKLGIIYPYVFLFYGLAGIIGPPVGGLLFDVTQTYTSAIILAGLICAGGAVIFVFLTAKANDVN